MKCKNSFLTIRDDKLYKVNDELTSAELWNYTSFVQRSFYKPLYICSNEEYFI